MLHKTAFFLIFFFTDDKKNEHGTIMAIAELAVGQDVPRMTVARLAGRRPARPKDECCEAGWP